MVVQYKVKPELVYDAFYKLDNSKAQIQAYVFDSVRSVLPTLNLDAAFEAKEEIALEVKTALKETMESFGYQIMQVCVGGSLHVPGHARLIFFFFCLSNNNIACRALLLVNCQ